MSLIQEALKRKQDGPPPSGGNLTSKRLTHDQVKTDRKNRPDTLPLVAIMIGGVSLVLILILMLLLFWRNSDPQGMAGMVQAPAEVAPAASVSLKTGLQEPAVPASAVPGSTPLPVPSVQPSPVPAPVAPAPAVRPTPVRALVPAPTPPRASVPVVQKPSWPTLKVMGVLTNPESDSDSVIINGQIRDPGEQIDGVTILRIETKGVLFRFNGETKFVKVGRSYPE